ncbi:MAG: ATP-binding protein [Opitutus sp.]
MNTTVSRLDAGGPADENFSVTEAMATWMQGLAPFGIFITDRELRIQSWNEWLVGHSQLTPREVIGRHLNDVYPDIAERRLTERYMQALAGEISVLSTALHKYLLPFRVTVAESSLPHMLQTVRIAPLRQGGEVVGTITIIEDVTQREFQAGILRRQQELDRLLSSSLATLLQATNPADEIPGIFSTISPPLGLDAYVSYLLSADEQMLQLNAASGISAKQREPITTLALSAADRSKLQTDVTSGALNIEILSDALERMGVKSRCSLPLVVGNRVLGMVCFGSYERGAIASADVNILARIARYIAIALDRWMRERHTVAASHAKDDFLAALSHELRTPLNPVLLVASDAAENPEYPEEAREAFRLIEKNALLEARLIDDLLDLTRIEHGKLSLEIQKLDVHGVLSDALTTVRSEVRERGLNLTVNLRAEPRTVMGDAARLQQVFWNIVKNAVKFTPSGGEISVTAVCDELTRTVVIEVTDTGIGMDASEVGRVFGAFSQGDHALRGRSHRFGGLGLGLAISRKLVDLHGGKIEATSAGKDQGSTFTIYLPLAPTDATVDGSPSEIGPPPAKAGSAPGFRHDGVRILLVEDHEPTRTALERLLERRGCNVISARTSTAALHEAARHRFDLVLSDIGLPDGDGFALMEQLRERHGLKGIALSGYGMEEDLIRSNAAGFFAHLTKPINAKVLNRTLDSAFPPHTN